MHGHRLFTSESVSGGHPDKVADQISDAVLDAALQAVGGDGRTDPGVRVACECLVRKNLVVVAGEIRLPKGIALDVEPIVRQAVRDAGYTNGRVPGFDADSLQVDIHLAQQSDEIFAGTSEGGAAELGAGDQGMMFGYAVDEGAEFMPLPIQASHAILRLHEAKWRSGELDWLRPDAKSQVTVEYRDKGRVAGLRRVIFSTHYAEGFALAQVKRQGRQLVKEALRGIGQQPPADAEILVNTAGEFTIGGPEADCGLTGRKLMVDTYGAMGRHGGGAFSGKDPTKVDRSAAYACRYAAKNVVAAGLASECEVQVSYAIGEAKPTLSVLTFGTGARGDDELTELVSEHFDLTPYGIIQALALWRPLYRQHCTLGHFGNTSAPWEQTDKQDELRKAVSSQ